MPLTPWNGRHNRPLTTLSLILDGRELYRDEHFVKDSLGFDGSSALHVLTLRNDKIIRVRFDRLTIPGDSTNEAPRRP